MYLVIFCYWVGPVPYLELFGAGPVEKNTLYIYVKIQNIISKRNLDLRIKLTKQPKAGLNCDTGQHSQFLRCLFLMGISGDFNGEMARF